MTKKITVTDICDQPHDEETEAVASHAFTVGRRSYETDVCADHDKAFAEALAPFIDHARRVKGTGTEPKRPQARRDRAASIRAWAKAEGIDVSDRGRLPVDVIGRYDEQAA